MGDKEKLDKYFHGTGDGTLIEQAGPAWTYVPIDCDADHCTPEERAVIEAAVRQHDEISLEGFDALFDALERLLIARAKQGETG